MERDVGEAAVGERRRSEDERRTLSNRVRGQSGSVIVLQSHGIPAMAADP